MSKKTNERRELFLAVTKWPEPALRVGNTEFHVHTDESVGTGTTARRYGVAIDFRSKTIRKVL